MVASNSIRASGEPGAVEEAKEQSEEMTEDLAVELPDERERRFRTPGFHRMRFDWRDDEERQVIATARHEAERVIIHQFADAFAIMSRLFDIVREPMVGPDGEILRDTNGFVVWKRQPDGWFIEDFTKLTKRQREDFLGSITTSLFNWEQRATEMWAEAMFAKAQFEERFAIAYDAPLKGTVDDRRASGNKDAAEERYFAIYMTVVSRKADAIVRSMDRIGQRLKDLLQT